MTVSDLFDKQAQALVKACHDLSETYSANELEEYTNRMLYLAVELVRRTVAAVEAGLDLGEDGFCRRCVAEQMLDHALDKTKGFLCEEAELKLLRDD